MTSEDLEYRECGPLLSYFYGAFALFLMLKKLQFSFTENALGKKKRPVVGLQFLEISHCVSHFSMVLTALYDRKSWRFGMTNDISFSLLCLHCSLK